MVMGFKNSPQILQRIMDKMFRDLRGKEVEIYMDDIVMYSKNLREHDELVRKVLGKLREKNMKVNPSNI